MAAAEGAIPPIRRVSLDLYSLIFSEGKIALVDTNPVAAMPSIHMAFPVVFACIAQHLFVGAGGARGQQHMAGQRVGARGQGRPQAR
jgi:hypothetical protein